MAQIKPGPSQGLATKAGIGRNEGRTGSGKRARRLVLDEIEAGRVRYWVQDRHSPFFVRNLMDVLISRPSRNTAHGDEFGVRHTSAHASGRPTKIERISNILSQISNNFDRICGSADRERLNFVQIYSNFEQF